MKICVTGGCGFIGSHVVPILSETGHEVVLIDDLSSGLEQYIHNISDIKLVRGSLLDFDLVREATQGIDVIIHLAASGNVMDSLISPMSNFNANVTGTLNVLEACRLNRIGRIIFSSTGGALMGNAPLPVDEASTPEPISPYGASKLSCENYIKVYSHCYGVEYTILRFGNVIGPNCYHKKGVINKFYNASITNGNIEIYDDPSRDFVSVKDLATTIFHIIDSKSAINNIFHLASGVETPISEVARIFQSKFKLDASRIRVTESRLGEVKRNYSNTCKARKKLDWRPNLDMPNVIEETIDWLADFTIIR